MTKRKLSVSSTRNINTYAYLHSAAMWSLEQAEGNEEGRFYNCMSSIIVSAFCIEAHLNHIGNEILPYWDNEIKKDISVQNKLKIISYHLNIVPDFSHRPFQSFKHIMKFRNIMAHGATVKVIDKSIQIVRDGERIRYPQTWWEEHSNIHYAKQWLADSEAMVMAIHEAAGKGKFPFTILGIGNYDGALLQSIT